MYVKSKEAQLQGLAEPVQLICKSQ